MKIINLFWTVLISFAIILFLFFNVSFSLYKIPTGSMEPTLCGFPRNPDYILANKIIYLFNEPERGDIVVFSPEGIEGLGKKLHLKRIMGLPNEIIEIKDGNIYINDTKLNDPIINNFKYLHLEQNIGKYGYVGEKIKIPNDSYFVLGDNTRVARDSRFLGFVPRKNIKSKAFFVYWPIKRIRLLK